jgi:nitrous oxide reductase accessory protein NosL
MIFRHTRFRQALYLLVGVIVSGMAPGVSNADSSLTPGRIGLDGENKMQISPQDRCPVCGMKVIRYPKFSSAIRLTNQDTYYFCSNGCMLKAWLHPEIFLKSTQQARSLAVVRDYFSGRQVDAQDVFWIAGSDVIGPMGPAMVAVQGNQSIDAFLRRHGGRKIFQLHELTDDLWLSLTGKSAKDR